MNLPLHICSFLLAASAGYGLLRSRQPAAPAAPPATVAAEATLSPEAELAALREALAAESTHGGPAMAARMQETLQLLGMDAGEAEEWAKALAVDTGAGFPALLEKLKSRKGNHTALLQMMVLDRWAQINPLGGAAYFKQLADATPNDKNADDALANFIRQWGLIDFEQAAARAGEYGDKTTRRTLREKAKQDPAVFLAWAKNHPEVNPITLFNSTSPENTEAIAKLAALDLERVLAWTKDSTSDKWRTQLGPTIAAEIAKRNPEEAIAWAKTLGDDKTTAAALLNVAKALAETDPTRALDLLKERGNTSDYQTMQTYREIIQKLGLDDPQRALSLIDGLPQGALRTEVVNQVLAKMMATDPAKAFAMAEKVGTNVGVNGLRMDESSIPKSPADARKLMDLAATAKESGFRNQVVQMALVGWLTTDQHSLGIYLKENLENPMFKSIKDELAPGLASLMTQGGTKLDPGLAEAVGVKPETMVGVMVDRDPDDAAQQLAKITDPEERAKLVNKLAESWGQRDRNDALDWAAGLTNADEQAKAYQSLAGNWMREDSHRASEWITTLQPGKPRDAAVRAMVQQIAGSDPDLSWQWSLTVVDPKLREESLGQAARAWSQKDASAADAALKNPTLSATDHAAITKALETPSTKQP